MREIQIFVTRQGNDYVYRVVIDKRQKSSGNRASHYPDHAGAAATALSVANSYMGEYYIFAPQDVLDCIPLNLRSGKSL